VGRPEWGSRTIHADSTVSPRRCKPRPILGGVCFAADTAVKMRWAAGLGFSWPQSKLDRIGHPWSICVGPLKIPLEERLFILEEKRKQAENLECTNR
jgi:hypothetical protein